MTRLMFGYMRALSMHLCRKTLNEISKKLAATQPFSPMFSRSKQDIHSGIVVTALVGRCRMPSAADWLTRV